MICLLCFAKSLAQIIRLYITNTKFGVFYTKFKLFSVRAITGAARIPVRRYIHAGGKREDRRVRFRLSPWSLSSQWLERARLRYRYRRVSEPCVFL